MVTENSFARNIFIDRERTRAIGVDRESSFMDEDDVHL